LLMACLIELVMVSYVYGCKRLIGNIKEMMGEPPNRVWKLLGYPVNPFWWICWLFITPLLLFVTLIFNFVNYSRTTMGSYTFPIWAEIVGWSITLSCMLWIPGVALYRVCITRNWRKLIQPTADWGREKSDGIQSYAVDKNGVELKPGEQNGGMYGQSNPALIDDNGEIRKYRDTSPYAVPFTGNSIHPADAENLRRYHEQHAYKGPLLDGQQPPTSQRF